MVLHNKSICVCCRLAAHVLRLQILCFVNKCTVGLTASVTVNPHNPAQSRHRIVKSYQMLHRKVVSSDFISHLSSCLAHARIIATFILYILEKFEVTIISSCMLTVIYELYSYLEKFEVTIISSCMLTVIYEL